MDPFAELAKLSREAAPTDLPALLGKVVTIEAQLRLRLAQPQVAETIGADQGLAIDIAAKRLGVSERWLYRNHARLPFARRIGRRLVFSAVGLDRYLAKGGR